MMEGTIYMFDGREFRLFRIRSEKMDAAALRSLLDDDLRLRQRAASTTLRTVMVFVQAPLETPYVTDEGRWDILAPANMYEWRPTEAMLLMLGKHENDCTASELLDEISSEHESLSVEEVPYKIFHGLSYERGHMLAANETLQRYHLPDGLFGIICQVGFGRFLPPRKFYGESCVGFRIEDRLFEWTAAKDR